MPADGTSLNKKPDQRRSGFYNSGFALAMSCCRSMALKYNFRIAAADLDFSGTKKKSQSTIFDKKGSFPVARH
jgi:hypothetical protein